ncbi:AAA family ATPase [Actinotalea ferrariae]|uniref:ATP-binding protein n=1 Tax=Actinotalea ferrariae TaxID=1386098 RepID=UPI001C8B4409|nr:LuxR family transcriptional regulator [Actinotalea ferrariae]MBX9245264.1 AAA family ATPase [Actinotalea ferrariae]
MPDAPHGHGLMEREHALRALADALDDVRDGRGRVVLVSGEAGIGKTSLVEHFLARLPGDVRVLRGAAEDLVTPRPLGPLREMFAAASVAGGSGVPSGLSDHDAVVDRILAETRPDPPARTAPPVVMVVEDAHWADEATLDVVRYVGRRVAPLALLLVVTMRPGDLADDHPLRRVLGALVGPEVVRVELEVLSPTAVGAMAAARGLDVGRVAGLGGNPFYITEVLRHPSADVPATVRDAVGGQVGRLSPATRSVLELVSVIPRSADVDLLDAIVDRALTCLEPAERSGLVRVDGARVAFRHELARRAVESMVPRGRRLHLSRRVLAELERRGADPSLLLHHASTAQDPAAIARWAPAATRSAAQGEAHRETVSASRLALARPELLDDGDRAQMHRLQAQALYALNQFTEAAAQADAAVACHAGPRGGVPPAPALAEALLLAARMQTMIGRPEPSRELALRAERVLEPVGPTPALAAAHELLANLDVIVGDGDGAVSHGERAVRLAAVTDAPDVGARATVSVAMARIAAGDLAGLDVLRGSVTELGRLGCHEHQARAASTLGVCLMWLGRHREAGPWLALADDLARDHGFDFVRFHAQANQADLLLRGGAWTEAEAMLRALLSQDTDAAALRVLPLAFLGRLLARRGDPAAGAMIDEACERAVASAQVRRMAAAYGAAVEHAWLSEDPVRCADMARRLAAVAERCRLVAARGEAMRYLRRCGQEAHTFPGCPDGYAAGIRGDAAAAAGAWARVGNPYEQALELVELADDGRAVEGVRVLDGLGALAAADLVRRRLRRDGVGAVPGRPRAERDGAGLTPRQREILDLVADGLSSPEIGRRLFLSRRTVDNHVASILEQLGVSSRRDALVVTGRRPARAHAVG